MEKQIIILDTSILIDLFRKTDKSNSVLVSLVRQGYEYSITAITEFEIYSGSTATQLDFWDKFLERTEVIPFDKQAARVAVEINRELKKKRKQIDKADLFIASIAVSKKLTLATLNKSHFERIDALQIL
jgi:tRNA(fMet)-specific endonuclease VapC